MVTVPDTMCPEPSVYVHQKIPNIIFSYVHVNLNMKHCSVGIYRSIGSFGWPNSTLTNLPYSLMFAGKIHNFAKDDIFFWLFDILATRNVTFTFGNCGSDFRKTLTHFSKFK